MKYVTWILVAFALLAGCRESGEFMGWTGSPSGSDGWREDYKASPADVWEAFRVVVRDNGTLKEERPEEMSLTGEYKPKDLNERDGISMKGQVIDKSDGGTELRTRLIVHAWYARSANDRERPDTAREYCNAVYRLLKAWKGEDVDEDPTVTTTSEEPVRDDESISFFKLTAAQAFGSCKAVVARYGTVEQADEKTLFIRGVKQNALEPDKFDVRVNLYDRTEEGKARTKVSIRVRFMDGDKPRPEIAKSYMTEVRKELEKQFGPQE